MVECFLQRKPYLKCRVVGGGMNHLCFLLIVTHDGCAENSTKMYTEIIHDDEFFRTAV